MWEGRGKARGRRMLQLASMPVNGRCGTSVGARVCPGEARDGDVGHLCILVVGVGVRWADGMADSIHADLKFTWAVWGHSSICGVPVLALLGNKLVGEVGATKHGCLHKLQSLHRCHGSGQSSLSNSGSVDWDLRTSSQSWSNTGVKLVSGP